MKAPAIIPDIIRPENSGWYNRINPTIIPIIPKTVKPVSFSCIPATIRVVPDIIIQKAKIVGIISDISMKLLDRSHKDIITVSIPLAIVHAFFLSSLGSVKNAAISAIPLTSIVKESRKASVTKFATGCLKTKILDIISKTPAISDNHLEFFIFVLSPFKLFRILYIR